MGRVETQVEELAGDRVRLRVEVPGAHVRHAVDHAASDLAAAVKIPGFRKGKVPMPVLMARVGKERVYAEAVESHIGGWFRNAAAEARIRPVSRPDYEYELPDSPDGGFSFTATVSVQPRVEVPDWTQLEVPAAEAEVPEEVVSAELEALQRTVAELVPADRPAQEEDVAVLDLVASDGAQRDYVVEIGDGRFVEEVNEALLGMTVGETKTVEWAEEDAKHRVEVTLKDLKEKVLPPLDDELARSASEFDTLAELRADVEGRLRRQVQAELDAEFRVAAADALADASGIEPASALVDARTAELVRGLAASLDQRGISLDTYLALTNRSAEELTAQLRAEASRSLARELVLEAAAEQLGIEVSDEEIASVLREQDESEETIEQVLSSPQLESLRADLRLRRALDRIVQEVKRIPVELARAREQLWTPGKERGARDTKLWTPNR
jgi:trigger factor